MTEITTLGSYLRREREHRGLSLRTISEKTKVSLGLLEGLEADDISRWPGGIFRRAFVRTYAQCVGLDPDDVVRRFEEQFKPTESALPHVNGNGTALAHVASIGPQTAVPGAQAPPWRSRLLGTAADLTVAAVLAFGSAAAGSRLLWPVMLIAVYYAIGILLSGTSPMVALLGNQRAPASRITVAPVSPPESRPALGRRAQVPRSIGLRQRRNVQARI